MSHSTSTRTSQDGPDGAQKRRAAGDPPHEGNRCAGGFARTCELPEAFHDIGTDRENRVVI